MGTEAATDSGGPTREKSGKLRWSKKRTSIKEMLQPLKRLSLVAQTTAALRTHLDSGGFGEYLPSERHLCLQLGISRMTLRAALARLTSDGWVQGGQGKRRRINRPRLDRSAIPITRRVLVLSPQPLSRLDPRELIWIDELRDTLGEGHFTLDFLHQPGCYTRRPESALEELAATAAPAAWVLYLSSAEMQLWFSERQLPAVIAGSRHPRVRLASVDVDYQAACRHAVGCFITRGHQHLMLLNPRAAAGGDLESAAAFRATGGAAGDKVRISVAQHDGSVAGICATLDHALARTNPPTAFLVSRPRNALTAIGHLIRCGLQFPKGAALIARDDDSFLEHVVPSVARYRADPSIFAHKLTRVVSELVAGGDARPREIRIIPQLIGGETLG